MKTLEVTPMFQEETEKLSRIMSKSLKNSTRKINYQEEEPGTPDKIILESN